MHWTACKLDWTGAAVSLTCFLAQGHAAWSSFCSWAKAFIACCLITLVPSINMLAHLGPFCLGQFFSSSPLRNVVKESQISLQRAERNGIYENTSTNFCLFTKRWGPTLLATIALTISAQCEEVHIITKKGTVVASRAQSPHSWQTAEKQRDITSECCFLQLSSVMQVDKRIHPQWNASIVS